MVHLLASLGENPQVGFLGPRGRYAARTCRRRLSPGDFSTLPTAERSSSDRLPGSVCTGTGFPMPKRLRNWTIAAPQQTAFVGVIEVVTPRQVREILSSGLPFAPLAAP